MNIRLSGSAATAAAPTTLSPTSLIIDWTCIVAFFCFFHNSCMDIFCSDVYYSLIFNPCSSGEKAQHMPYEVQVTVPIENYAPIEFTLAKTCSMFF